MALSFVQGVTFNSDTTPATSGALTTLSVGDLVFVHVGGDGGITGAVTSVTDSAGNTYTQWSGADFANTGGTLNSDIWWTEVTTGGSSITVSVAFDDLNENCAGVAQQFTGFTGVITADKLTRTQGSSTSPNSGATATTTYADELVIGYAIHAGTASNFSLGAGYTNLTQLSVGSRMPAMESKVVSATGTQTATFTIAASRAWICGVATFSDVASTVTKTQTATARISVTTTKTQTSTARISNSVTKTQSATARISVAVTKTQSATARISAAVTKTQTAVGRIEATATKTQGATARISSSFTKTQDATARISVAVTKTQNATSRISVAVTKTQNATSRISVAVTKTQDATARVQVTSTKTQAATARMSASVTLTQSATASIFSTAAVLPSRMLMGVGG